MVSDHEDCSLTRNVHQCWNLLVPFLHKLPLFSKKQASHPESLNCAMASGLIPHKEMLISLILGLAACVYSAYLLLLQYLSVYLGL